MPLIIRPMLALAALALLAGCAGVPREAGFAEVGREAGARLGAEVAWRHGDAADAEIDARIAQLLAQPLTVDAAVQVALLNNRLLQAEYEALGVAQAELVQAGLLRNPGFGWSRQEGGAIAKASWGLELDFLGLLLRAPRQRIESMRFEHARLRVTQAVLRHAAETRRAWFEAQAAERDAAFMAQVAELAAVEAELGERSRAAGNLSRRDVLRQQVFAAEMAAALAQAREAAFAARERLNRLLGTWGGQAGWKLAGSLPELPATLPDMSGIEAWGLGQRLDLRMAQREAEALAAGLGLARDARFVNVLDLGVETERATGERRITGPTLKLELPVFDQGQARVSKLEAQYRQSEARLFALAVDTRAEIREHAQRATTAHAVAQRQRDLLVPLHRQLVEESMLHYNGMLIGVYELLADARAQIGAVQAHIAATRDFWTALTDLQLAAGGRLPQELAAAPAAKPAAMPHQHEEHRHD